MLTPMYINNWGTVFHDPRSACRQWRIRIPDSQSSDSVIDYGDAPAASVNNAISPRSDSKGPSLRLFKDGRPNKNKHKYRN